MKDEFKFFKMTMVFVLLVYAAILFFYLIIRRRQLRDGLLGGNVGHNTSLDDAAGSAWGKFGALLLIFTRWSSFFYMLIVACIIMGNEDPKAFRYFPNWNSVMVSAYFLCAAICSSLQFLSNSRVVTLPGYKFSTRLSMTTRLLYEVSGATAILVLVLSYGYVEGSLSSRNSPYLVSTLLLILDMVLNRMNVRFSQYPANIAWAVFYLLVVWPAVFSGNYENWPYRFLRTDSAACFGNYAALFLWDFFFYLIWYSMHIVRDKVYEKVSSPHEHSSDHGEGDSFDQGDIDVAQSVSLHHPYDDPVVADYDIEKGVSFYETGRSNKEKQHWYDVSEQDEHNSERSTLSSLQSYEEERARSLLMSNNPVVWRQRKYSDGSETAVGDGAAAMRSTQNQQRVQNPLELSRSRPIQSENRHHGRLQPEDQAHIYATRTVEHQLGKRSDSSNGSRDLMIQQDVQASIDNYFMMGGSISFDDLVESKSPYQDEQDAINYTS
jgi:hypothetical protein